MREIWRSGVDSGGTALILRHEQPLGFAVEEYPEAVDPECGAERDVGEVESGDHDPEDTRPRSQRQQSDAGHQPGDTERDEEEGRRGATKPDERNGDLR